MRIELTDDEALVLFEWLARNDDADSYRVEDQAELRVLWDLQAQLESALPGVLAPDYRELLAGARARVRDPEQ